MILERGIGIEVFYHSPDTIVLDVEIIKQFMEILCVDEFVQFPYIGKTLLDLIQDRFR